jgi:hypothetical protein
MIRVLLILALVFLASSPVMAEEEITTTVHGDTSNADQAQLNEIKTVQAQQLQMIMRMNKAEDLRNAEIQKRHEDFIKNIPALTKPLELPPVVAEKHEKKCGFWCRLFGGGDDETLVKTVVPPQPDDTGAINVDDF